MKQFALACTAAAALSAVAAPPPDLTTAMTAREMVALCRHDDAACAGFMSSVRNEVASHPETYGKSCDEQGPAWRDSAGNVIKGTPPGILARAFVSGSNKVWWSGASARDAAIWIVQATIACNIGRIAAPGEPGFPSKMP